MRNNVWSWLLSTVGAIWRDLPAVFQTIGESEMPSVLSQLLPMIKSYNERTKDDYACEDFLVLLVYMYSVVGEIRSGKELDAAEEEVKKALVQAICNEPELSPLLQKVTGKIPLAWWETG